jgi:hypothetical protein
LFTFVVIVIVALRSIRLLASFLSGRSPYEVVLAALEDMRDEVASNNLSSVYYLILATMNVYGDNLKEALVATEGQSTLEL